MKSTSPPSGTEARPSFRPAPVIALPTAAAAPVANPKRRGTPPLNVTTKAMWNARKRERFEARKEGQVVLQELGYQLARTGHTLEEIHEIAHESGGSADFVRGVLAAHRVSKQKLDSTETYVETIENLARSLLTCTREIRRLHDIPPPVNL